MGYLYKTMTVETTNDEGIELYQIEDSQFIKMQAYRIDKKNEDVVIVRLRSLDKKIYKSFNFDPYQVHLYIKSGYKHGDIYRVKVL